MNNMPDDKNRRVLIIDDKHSIHDDFRKILSPATATETALEAAEAAVYGRPADAVQHAQFEVDCRTPLLDGFETTRRIAPHKDQYQTAETPVVWQEAQLVDLARLRDVSDDDPPRIRRLVEIYLDQAASLLIGLQLAIDACAPDRLAEAAHKLLGSSISCGV